ncbi:hypothetical protein DSECCO2_595950 [anaerobic digester metagenome]
MDQDPAGPGSVLAPDSVPVPVYRDIADHHLDPGPPPVEHDLLGENVGPGDRDHRRSRDLDRRGERDGRDQARGQQDEEEDRAPARPGRQSESSHQ